MRSLWLLSAFIAAPLTAQAEPFVARAAETITPEDIIRHVSIIAADSMQGRGTPSPGLERTAEYVVSEFKRFGLKPGASGGYLQRFGVTRWTIDTSVSEVRLTSAARRDVARLGKDARYILGKIPDRPVRGSVVLMAGADSQASLAGPDVRGKVVLLVADLSKPVPLTYNDRVIELAEAGPAAVVVLSNRDSASFAQRLTAAGRPKFERDSESDMEAAAPVIELHERNIGELLSGLGVNPDRLRQSIDAVGRSLPELEIEVRLSRQVLERSQVSNVIGILDGSDPLLKEQFLVYSAHIDHIGISPGQPDSINNGADDNASGVAGLLELGGGLHPAADAAQTVAPLSGAQRRGRRAAGKRPLHRAPYRTARRRLWRLSTWIWWAATGPIP